MERQLPTTIPELRLLAAAGNAAAAAEVTRLRALNEPFVRARGARTLKSYAVKGANYRQHPRLKVKSSTLTASSVEPQPWRTTEQGSLSSSSSSISRENSPEPLPPRKRRKFATAPFIPLDIPPQPLNKAQQAQLDLRVRAAAGELDSQDAVRQQRQVLLKRLAQTKAGRDELTAKADAGDLGAQDAMDSWTERAEEHARKKKERYIARYKAGDLSVAKKLSKKDLAEINQTEGVVGESGGDNEQSEHEQSEAETDSDLEEAMEDDENGVESESEEDGANLEEAEEIDENGVESESEEDGANLEEDGDSGGEMV